MASSCISQDKIATGRETVKIFCLRAFLHIPAVPDNLGRGVTSPCRYEPEANPTYQDLASHYNTAVLPARVRKPRDKAKVESGVLGVERQILARLRNRTFFSLAGLNAAIRVLLVDRVEDPVYGEVTERDNRRPAYRLKNARLRLSACVENIDYRHPRGLDKSLILSLADKITLKGESMRKTKKSLTKNKPENT